MLRALSVFLLSSGTLFARPILLEAESFADRGGWSLDQQFMDQMGSPYLIAHGMGRPVSDASTTIDVRESGVYHVYARCYNWTSPWTGSEGPGKFSIKVNGKQVATDKSSVAKYIALDRKWKKGDVVEISFPMHNSVEYMPNVPQYVAILHGPITLAMRTGTEDLAHLKADDSRFGQMASGKKLPIDKAPYLVAKEVEDIANSLEPVDGKPLHFKLKCRMENAIEGELEPFFELHDSRYMLYWLALSSDGYKEYIDNLAKEEKARMELESKTTDKVQPGEQQPESDHFMEADETSTRGITNDVPFRDARNGGSFSYLMQTKGRTDLSVRIRYWGQDEWRTCEYDLYVDDTLVTSVNNSRKWRSSQWKYETYPIPAAALKGKKQVRVKFVAKPFRQVGEIYEVRLVKK